MKQKWRLKFCPQGRERAVLKAEALWAYNPRALQCSLALSPLIYRRAENGMMQN